MRSATRAAAPAVAAVLAGLIAAALAGAPVAARDGERAPVEERIRWLGVMRTVAVYAPQTAPESLPVLLVLGPSGRSARYAIDSWRQVADEEGVLVAALAPEAQESWRVPRDGPALLRAIVDRLARRHALDRRRVVLFGDGAGGSFALLAGLMQPEYFAAAASFSGDLEPHLRAVAERAARPLPVYLYRGARCSRLSLAELERTAGWLEEAGLPARAAELPGLGCDFEKRGRRAAAGIWNELSRHRLEGEPRYAPLPIEG